MKTTREELEQLLVVRLWAFETYGKRLVFVQNYHGSDYP